VNEHLMRAVLYAALFFETSTEDECDLDLAVKQLEGIAAELEKLSDAEQDAFRRFALSEAERDPLPEMRSAIHELVDGLLPAD
jgi:hypothetical protein